MGDAGRKALKNGTTNNLPIRTHQSPTHNKQIVPKNVNQDLHVGTYCGPSRYCWGVESTDTVGLC